MNRSGLRFSPPPFALTAEVRWVLARAFAPPGAPAAPLAHPTAAGALAAARRLALAARIGARHQREALAVEVGAESAEGFHRERLAATVAELRQLALAREVTATAASLGLPVAFLKYVALELAGLLTTGSRGAADVDVLVPAGRVGELARDLVARGFCPLTRWGEDHHLPTLAHPERGTVEIHRHLPGLSAPGARRFATFDDLAGRDLLRRVETPAGEAWIPAREILVAHALVHGIAQHGWDPASYPLLRMVADLLDLGVAGDDGGVGEALLAQAQSWLGDRLAPAEVAAAGELCAALAAGEAGGGPAGAAERLPADGDGGRLLRHALAGAFDEKYRDSLKLHTAAPALSDRSALAGGLRQLGRALILSRRQIDEIYGPPRSRLGYLGRRLGRPFDLVWRVARRLAQWLLFR